LFGDFALTDGCLVFGDDVGAAGGEGGRACGDGDDDGRIDAGQRQRQADRDGGNASEDGRIFSRREPPSP